MRILLPFALTCLISISNSFAEDIDFQKLAQTEKKQLADCMTDALKVIEKYQLGKKVFGLWEMFEATCGMEMERVKSAAETGLTDKSLKQFLPGQIVFGMVQNASDWLEKRPMTSCSGDGCSANEYRACLVRQMPSAIRSRKRPIDFEALAQKQCEDSEAIARSTLSNDFDNVQRHHFAGGLNHKMNETIGGIILEIRQNVVVLYAEDLVKVQPGRKSCKPEMCGASPCISLDENRPTEYQCVITQK